MFSIMNYVLLSKPLIGKVLLLPSLVPTMKFGKYSACFNSNARMRI